MLCESQAGYISGKETDTPEDQAQGGITEKGTGLVAQSLNICVGTGLAQLLMPAHMYMGRQDSQLTKTYRGCRVPSQRMEG